MIKTTVALWSTEGKPLSSLEAKNRLCYGLGLYGDVTRNDLFTIARVRNLFAHAAIPIDFSFEAVRNVCLSMKAIKAYQAMPDFQIKLPLIPDSPRQMFQNTCLAIWFMVSIGRMIKPGIPAGTTIISVDIDLRTPLLP